MGVVLKKRNGASGKKSLFLIICHNGERHYEFLNIHLVRAKTPAEAEKNKENLKLAETIRANRELELSADEYNYTPAFKKNIDFIAYYNKYADDYSHRDKRIVKYSLHHFKEFIKTKGFDGSINAKFIDGDLCRQYREYLQTAVNGETICNYFTKFKRVISKAHDENILKKDFTKGIINTKDEGLKKQVLTIDEIQLLAQAHCGNNDVRRAFLFCLHTGLRWCDVRLIKWQNIHNNKLSFVQRKTKNNSESASLSIPLNNTAIKLIGERGKPDELIFKLPSHTACLKDLRVWVKNAGIEKHITWHCGRHSFAVNLLDSEVAGADVKTVSGLLGHASIKHTDKYLHYIGKRGKEAVNKLPEINL
ncbi:MAG TPA: site-specific integrase [Bacteroidales bacterium]|nr:site-specific integrase [Bacteroidales bacterium]